ncbi:MAG: glycosyltransferase family 4 protein [Planctomyces sp.]|nr:glycosyltransferase family 4 protein [Planctomyces sp.]
MAEPQGQVLMLSGRFSTRGRTTQSLMLAEGLIDRGYEVRVVCPGSSCISPDRRRRIRFYDRSSLEWPLVAPLVWRTVRRDLEGQPPDLIHAQHRSVLPLARWLAASWRVPIVLSVHDYLAPGEALAPDPVWLAGVIAVSDSVRRELLDRTRLSPDAVHVVHGGVRIPPPEDAAGVLDPRHVPVVGTAGPLEAVKGLRFFLSAAAIVLQEMPRTQFLVAGAGPEERKLRKQARDLHLGESVTFVSSFPDFSASLEAMDIYVLPSLKQGLGTIMLEAMARGLPVVATRTGGVDTAVSDGVTGMLVPPSDSAALAARTVELLRDPLRARSIGQQARELASREFRVDRMVEETEQVYRRVLETWRAPSPCR